MYYVLREALPLMVMISIKSSAGFRAPKNFFLKIKILLFFQVFQKNLIAKKKFRKFFCGPFRQFKNFEKKISKNFSKKKILKFFFIFFKWTKTPAKNFSKFFFATKFFWNTYKIFLDFSNQKNILWEKIISCSLGS